MPKVELTARRTVEATSPWFTVDADMTRVIVRTDFGFVDIRRTNKGLYVHCKVSDTENAFLSTGKDGETFTPIIGQHDFMVALRPAGLVQVNEIIDENETTPVAKFTRDWMSRGKQDKK